MNPLRWMAGKSATGRSFSFSHTACWRSRPFIISDSQTRGAAWSGHLWSRWPMADVVAKGGI
eukprot:5961960-Prymnesium_polylepis.1